MPMQTATEDTFVPTAGDVVELRSGGQRMTVERRYDPAVDGPVAGGKIDVLCIWFTPDGVCHSHWFPDIVLKKGA